MITMSTKLRDVLSDAIAGGIYSYFYEESLNEMWNEIEETLWEYVAEKKISEVERDKLLDLLSKFEKYVENEVIEAAGKLYDLLSEEADRIARELLKKAEREIPE